MAEQTKVTTLEKVVVRFSGDSGDGMQLTGTIFSNLSAILGNDISTFPDFPAEIRAPQGTLSGVSGFQVHLGSRKIYTPGDKADVLVAMNPAALKVNVKHIKPNAIVIIDTDSFLKNDLTKAQFVTEDSIRISCQPQFPVTIFKNIINKNIIQLFYTQKIIRRTIIPQ
jgi:2-oxoglutarate ferredoxin oxidoreductase subunit alpha